MTTPNPLWVTYEVMNRMGYDVGDKLDIPFGVVKANTSGTGYSIENLKGEYAIIFGSSMTLDEAIDRIVYLAKLKRGDADISHPTQLFDFPATKSEMGESGRFRVVWGRDFKTREFDSKENADAFASTKSGAYVSPIKEVKRWFGYKVRFIHPLTGEKMFVDDAEFDSKEEAKAYFDENFEQINDATNAKLQAEREKKGEKKTLTSDDVVSVTMVKSGEGWSYAVVVDKKYANNDGMAHIIKEGFASSKDARAYADKVKDDIFNAIQKHKEEEKSVVFFDTGEDSRIGEDWRNGKDVEAEDFMNTFGFRGVQFGNWTNQEDRQMAVNQAYDAFMDLASLIGVSPSALSLNGELGIAFGARGMGNASAHYEPKNVVINLTKTRGAGSLAHEWWHALDNYLSRRAGRSLGMVTSNRSIEMREELRNAFNAMLDMVGNSEYAKRSAKKGDYWGRIEEVTARLLSEWIDKELKNNGKLNTFLSRGASIERYQKHNYNVYTALEKLSGREPMPFEEYKETPESLIGIPYPTVKEVEQFGASLRNIFDTLQEKVDEKTGKIALFHKLEGNTKPVTKQDAALRDALIDVLSGAGVEVVTDAEKVQRVIDDKLRRQEASNIRFFRTPDGHAYGFTMGGKIYIDARIAGADTPIHEYTHLWSEALRKANPKEWDNIVGLMKGSPLWEEVKKKYPDLKTDSDIADEVLAHYSGKRGAQRLRKAQEEALKNRNGILEKTAAVAAINNVRTALKRFWKGVADFFGVHFNSAEEVADKVLSDLLNGVKPEVTGKTDAALAKEEADIIAKAKADGTYLNAPNGKPTNLTPRQWVQVRTKAFKKWFGDWEKRARVEKLRKSESASITGGEIEITDDYKQNKKNALEYGKRLQGEYTNADTGVSVQLQRGRRNGGIKEVLQHNYKDAAHILSIAAIPQIIEKSVYIESEANNDTAKNPDVVEYQHFVCGLKIGNEDYTVHSLVAVDKHGNRYYDHNLTHIEKTKLLDSIERQAVKGQGFDTTSSTELTTLNGYKGKKLLELLQTNSSKVVDENGEPLVVYHGTTTPDITTFDLAKTRSGSAFWFANTEAHKGVFYSNQNDENLIMMPLFINMRTPLLNDADSMESYATDETHDGGLILGKLKDLGFSEEEYQELLDKGLNDNSYLAAGNVTNPNQIKSATDNIGSFSSNPDIRYQFVGERGAESVAGNISNTDEDDDILYRSDDTLYRIREEAAPVNTGIGYKVFVLKNGELYPPMVANPNGEATPVGVWLNADAAPIAGQSKTGRNQVKAGGKGTQGGSGKLAYRPGCHLGVIPYALQFNRADETGERTLFPANFVWAEVEYANDVDYQEEAMSYGYNQNGKFQHSYAGLPRVPENGSYRYRTNPNPETDPWIITGAMRIKRLLTPTEVDEMVKAAGREPQRRQEGAITDEQITALNAEIANEYREGVGAYTDDKVSMENDPWSKMAGYNIRSKKERMAFAERERRRMVAAVTELAERLGIADDVEIVTDLSGLQGRQRRAKGVYRKSSGKITIYIPNHINVADAVATFLHEAVAHKGLRNLFGKHFDEFLDKVYANSNSEIRSAIDALAKKKKLSTHTATEEYLAGLAEKTDFEHLPYNGWLQRVKTFFIEMLSKIGIKALDTTTLTDNELRFILWRSYRYMAGKDKGIIAFVEDTAMKMKLGVGYSEKAVTEGAAVANEEEDTFGTDVPREVEEVNRRFNERLSKLVANPNQKDRVLHLGNASGFLRAGGLLDAEILLEFDKLLRKSRSNYKNNHPFDISDAKNLPLAIHNPIAIFDNTNGKEAGRVILTELKKNGRNFIVVVQAKEQRRKGGVLLEINEISTLYPKEAKGVIKWLIDGNATNIDKNKALRFIEELQPLAGTTIKSEELVSAAKIIENFENPKAKALDYLHHSDRNISEALRNPKLVSAAKIVENFENQKIEGENSEEEELYRDDEETEETEETEEVDGGSQSDTKQLRDILIYGNLSFAERTTAAMLLYSNLQHWDKKRKADAVKAIGENIADLAKVMRLQRDFDKATVKRVHDLACVLMESGYLSDLKEQEIKRLLAAVKNSVGKEDIDASVQKVMDIMIDNMLRRGKAALSAIESVRGSKTDTRGVEVQGMLGVDGQTIVKAFKEAKKIVNPCAGKTEGENGENTAWGAAFESVYSRMDSKDQAVADEASLEYAGMQMAQQWYDEIAKSKLEEETIRLELKGEHDKKSAEERRTDSYREFAASMEEAIRQNKIERAQAYFNLAGRLSDSLRGSVENALEFNEAEKRRIGEIHHAANSDMQGRSAKEHQMPDSTRKALNNLLGNSLFAPLATYMEMLRLFGAKSVNGEGYLFNLFGRGWIDARQKEIRGVRGKLEMLDAKAKEVFGGKVETWGDLIRAVGKLPKGKVSFFNGGEMQETELPQGNLMYIYMVNKMLDGKMKLRKMGISEEDVLRIEEFLDPRLKEIADWLQEEFLVETRNEYNKTHKRMFGASMASVENYFPLRILNNALDVKADELDRPEVTDGISTVTGSIIKRRRNSKPLDILNADALHVILGHVSQMEHWNAYAEFNRDLNTLRSYRHFRNQVQNMETIYGNGKNLWNKFNDVCQMAAGVYKPKGDEAEKAALAVAQGVTAAAVSFRLYTALKQFASLPAFIPYTRAYYLAKAMMRPDKSWKWCMENLPIFEERWKSRVSGDPRLVKSFLTAADWRRNLAANCARAGMAPNAFIDALTCSMGAYAVYNTRKKQYLKDGYSEEQAERKAIQDAEMVYNETQQSGEDAFTSTMQRDRTWWKSLFTIFRNASMAYQRQLHGALRDFGNVMRGGVDERVAFVTKQLLREKGIQPNENGEWSEADYKREEAIAKRKVRRQFVKDGLSVATFGYIMQLAWNISGYLPYLLFGDDDETKDEFWDDIWTHTFGGWLEGFTGGDVMSLAIGMLLNGEYDSWKLKKEMPVTSATYDAIGHLLKGDFGAFVSNSTNLLIQMSTGVNPQSLTDGALAIMDACGGDPALANEAVICVSRILSVPQSQIDELYFDELGLRGDEVSKYTPAQLAERYALYKVKRGRFFAPWSWDDEELIEKQEEKANTAIKERLGHAGFTEVTEAYERYEKIAKEIGEQVNALKKAEEDGSIKQDEGKKRMDAIKQDRNFNTYALFTNLDKVLEAMSKRYMAAKSPEEAAMYAEAVERYRLAMLDALSADNYAELIEAISRAREINVRTQEEWRNKYKK